MRVLGKMEDAEPHGFKDPNNRALGGQKPLIHCIWPQGLDLRLGLVIGSDTERRTYRA